MFGDTNLPTVQRAWEAPKEWKVPTLGIILSIALIVIGGFSLHFKQVGSTNWLTKLKLEGAIVMMAVGGIGVFVGSAILIMRCPNISILIKAPNATESLDGAKSDYDNGNVARENGSRFLEEVSIPKRDERDERFNGQLDEAVSATEPERVASLSQAKIFGNEIFKASMEGNEPQLFQAHIKKVSLPNYVTRHINEHGEVFSLTPIGGHRCDQYQGDDYQLACLEIALKIKYNERGYLIHKGKELKHSLVKKDNDMQARAHVINLWIQSCYFVVVKSNFNRYWFLHYDDGQSKDQDNKVDGMQYNRPNYSDLKPILPYEIESVALQENETVRVLVVHPEKGYDINNPNNSRMGNFDEQAFRAIVGRNNITSITTICYRELTDTYPIEIDFQTIDDELSIFPMGKRDHLIYKKASILSHSNT